MDYPVKFITIRRNSFRWYVASIYPDRMMRDVCGPYWSRFTALRIEQSLTQHFRNGYDMARDDLLAASNAKPQKESRS